MTPRVSAVVPTYNRPDRLNEVLPSYYAQAGVAEVIVVDDASPVDISALVKQHGVRARARGVSVRLVRLDTNMGAAAARQRGVDEAVNPIILMGEDDVVLAPDLVAHALPHLERRPKLGLVGARVINVRVGEDAEAALIRADRHELLDPIDYRWFVGNFESRCPQPIEVPFVQSIGLWRRDAFRKVRFFEGYAGNGYREETDPQVQLLDHGLGVLYEPRAVSFHLPHVDKGGSRKVSRWKAFRWTLRNNRLFLRRHHARLRENRFAPYPKWFMQAYLVRKILPEYAPWSKR